MTLFRGVFCHDYIVRKCGVGFDFYNHIDHSIVR